MKFALNLIRKFFSWLDVVVYKCVAIIFQLIVDLANVQIFTDSTINEFANRMYIILGLIMLFKIMISFIQILIDPDTISDKEKGAGNILKRVTISLALIALVPSIFKFAREVQGYIVPVIPRVILGINDRATTTRYDENGNEVTSESDVDVVNESNIGDTVAWQSFLPFFNYNEGCEDGSLKLNSGYSDELLSVFSVGSASEHVNDTCSESQDENGYKYDYTFLISTAVGVYLLFILIQVAVAIAIRAIKFGICEFVAPIPIASYVDPKTSKSTFDKWVSTSVKVYLDLFTRLIIVYFVVYIMIVIFGDPTSITKIYENVGKDWFRTTLVILFLILGLFKFVKEAPKFISNLLGLNTDGDIGNMFKGAFSSAAGVAGAAVGGVGNFINGVASEQNKGKRIIKGLASGAAGFTSGLWRGQAAAFKGKNAKDVYGSTVKGTFAARNQHIADRANGVGYFDRARAGMLDYFGINDDITLAETTLKSINAIQEKDKKYKGILNDKIGKAASEVSWSSFRRGGSKNISNLKALMNSEQAKIESSNDDYLKDLLGALNKTGANFGRKSNGEYISYGDLGAIQAAAHHLGMSNLERQLAPNGDLFLALQKELQNDGRVKNIMNAAGARSSLNDNAEIKRSLSELDTAIATNISNIGLSSYSIGEEPNQVTYRLKDAEDWQDAYRNNPSAINDALDNRVADVSDQIANSKTSAARASNQQHRNLNNK